MQYNTNTNAHQTHLWRLLLFAKINLRRSIPSVHFIRKWCTFHCRWVSEWVSQWVTGWARDSVSESLSERVIEWASHWVSELVSERVTEWASHWVGERVSQQLIDNFRFASPSFVSVFRLESFRCFSLDEQDVSTCLITIATATAINFITEMTFWFHTTDIYSHHFYCVCTFETDSR